MKSKHTARTKKRYSSKVPSPRKRAKQIQLLLNAPVSNHLTYCHPPKHFWSSSWKSRWSCPGIKQIIHAPSQLQSVWDSKERRHNCMDHGVNTGNTNAFKPLESVCHLQANYLSLSLTFRSPSPHVRFAVSAGQFPVICHTFQFFFLVCPVICHTLRSVFQLFLLVFKTIHVCPFLLFGRNEECRSRIGRRRTPGGTAEEELPPPGPTPLPEANTEAGGLPEVRPRQRRRSHAPCPALPSPALPSRPSSLPAERVAGGGPGRAARLGAGRL